MRCSKRLFSLPNRSYQESTHARNWGTSVHTLLGAGLNALQSEVIVDDPWEEDPEWAIKHYKTWQEGMKLPESQPLPALQLANSQGLSEDVEMDFYEEGIPINEPHIDVIITGEVVDILKV